MPAKCIPFFPNAFNPHLHMVWPTQGPHHWAKVQAFCTDALKAWPDIISLPMRYGANSIMAALSECEVVWQLASILSPNPWGLSIMTLHGLQAFAGIVTVSVGHCHPKVVAAVDRQNHLLQHTTNIYLNNEIAEYAQELTAKLPDKLNVSCQSR